MKKISIAIVSIVALALTACGGSIDVKKLVETDIQKALQSKGMQCGVEKDTNSVQISCEDSLAIIAVKATVVNKVKPVEADSAAVKDSTVVAPVADTAVVDTTVAAPADTVAPAPADTVAPVPAVREVKDSLVVPAIDSITVPAEQEIKTAQMSCYCEMWTPIGCQYSNSGNCRCARWRCN